METVVEVVEKCPEEDTVEMITSPYYRSGCYPIIQRSTFLYT